jgi:lipoprotein-anchoring transpeptidase ErfK/SrfK
MRFFARLHGLCAFALIVAGWSDAALAQAPEGRGNPAPKMRKARDLMRKQAPPKVEKAKADVVTSDNARVVVSISKQRVFLYGGEELYIDSPISSGKSAGMTPTGSFTVIQKDPNHRSNIYGSFVDSSGRTVRAGVSTRVDSAPSGTHFVGSPMKWFMRLTNNGIGLHVGLLPGYPASHGCIRLPEAIAPLIYQKVKIGTPVVIEQ